MTEEVPLSEFVTEEEPDEQDAAAAQDAEAQADAPANKGAAGGQDDRPIHPSEVTPISSTSTYDPAGVACKGCGEAVDRGFHTTEGVRCLECVSWDRES